MLRRHLLAPAAIATETIGTGLILRPANVVELAARVEALAAMPLLRMKDASFTSAALRAGPVTLDVATGERAALTLSTPREATVVALMAAGVAKASAGTVLIGDYDPRVQSVHCKRIAAFVPHEPLQLDDGDFLRYIGYRAALWNVDAGTARERALALRERLDDMHEAFAYPLIGALIASPQIVVLDRPQAVYARSILDVVEGRALFSTHAQQSDAQAFA
jgi:ABC-2 type transport system ATP-binding protein